MAEPTEESTEETQEPEETKMCIRDSPHISSEPALLGGLLIMSVVRSLGAGVQTPAVNAVIPQLVPGDQLMRYNGINAAMQLSLILI